MGELLPCPFCGCDPMPDYCSTNDGPAYLFHCQSKNCPAWPSVQGDTEAEAIAAWNERPAPIGVSGLAEELEKCIEAWLTAKQGAAYNLAAFVAGAKNTILAALRSCGTTKRGGG